MYILTQGAPLENSKDKIYRVQSPELEKEYIEAGYRQHERIYKVINHHSEYMVYCPEFRNGQDGLEPVVIIPEFLIPRRRYPVEVYLFAIDVYSSNPEKGQREVAEETRKRFGLETFAHTTLGRALKAFVNIVGSARPDNGGTDSEDGNTTLQTAVAGAVAARPPGFPAVQATWPMRERAARFLRGSAAQPEWRAAAEAYREIARKWFCDYQRLLL